MARHRKSLTEHEMNGNPGRRRLPQVTLEGTHLPVGAPPKGMPKDEQVIWTRFTTELPWLNATHRAQLELAVHNAHRYHRLRKFFDSRRAALKRKRQPEAYAELNDKQTRPHPLVTSFRDARDAYRTMLGELGGNPAAQSRLLSYIDEAMRRRDAMRVDEKETFLT